MEWEYKKIKIHVESDGYFHWEINGNKCKASSLNDAKEEIDEQTRDYYRFSSADLDKLLSKLNVREVEMMKALIDECNNHIGNPHCSLGFNVLDWELSFLDD